MARQLPLPIALEDDASFSNFYLAERGDGKSSLLAEGASLAEGSFSAEGSRSAEGSPTIQGCSRAEAVQVLLAMGQVSGAAAGGVALSAEFAVFLWGPEGSGKTHLAQACLRQFVEAGRRAIYLPLLELLDHPPNEVLSGLDQVEIVCVDDINLVAGNESWQQGLFDLHNRLRDSGGSLLVTGTDSPGNSGITLPDLSSRLAAATGFALTAYSDEERIDILIFRADRLGLSLSKEAAYFLVNRAPRDLHTLVGYLKRLDRDALADHQRKLTIPFIKAVFAY